MERKIFLSAALVAAMAAVPYRASAEDPNHKTRNDVSTAYDSDSMKDPYQDKGKPAASNVHPDQRASEVAQLDRSDKTSRAMMSRGSEREADEIIRESSRALHELKAGKVSIPQSQLAKAQCVAVFPNVTSAALVVGRQHGDGIGTCKTAQGQWSRLAFLDLTGASIGAQLGAKSTDMVVLFMSQKAKDALSKGTLTFGGDVTATAGSHDINVGVDTAGSDVVAFSSESGLFAGASLNGTRVSLDDDTQRAFYRDSSTIGQTLGNGNIPENQATVRELLKDLPQS